MFGFVSREKYEIAQNNYRLTYQRKKEIEEENVKLQRQIKQLQLDNKTLSELVDVYKGKQKEAKTCAKCGKLFIPKTIKQKNCEECIAKAKKTDKEEK